MPKKRQSMPYTEAFRREAVRRSLTSMVNGCIALEGHKILSSMSRKENCWDNAVIESFFSRLKLELVSAEHFKTVEQAYQWLFEYIEVFYNRVGRHPSLGHKSPTQYEENYYSRCA